MTRDTTDGQPPAPGLEKSGAPQPIDPTTGQHKAYWVLSDDERAKGFIRPVRQTYIHHGPAGPTNPLRYMTDDEHARYDQFKYVMFEMYPGDENAVTGRFWTQEQLDRSRKHCGVATTMSRDIAETYSRDSTFYGSTFCCGCRAHFPVAEFRWDDAEAAVVGS